MELMSEDAVKSSREGPGAGASGKRRVRLRDKDVLSTQRKAQRARHHELVSRLDALLPPNSRRDCSKNGAGDRSLGTVGRSLLDVLEDAVDHMHQWHARRAIESNVSTPHSHISAPNPSSPCCLAGSEMGVGAVLGQASYREGIQHSDMLAAIEVDVYNGWTVTAINSAARNMFKDLPFVHILGQSLQNALVHADDMQTIQTLWDQALAGKSRRKASSSTATAFPPCVGEHAGGTAAACYAAHGGSGGSVRIRMLTAGRESCGTCARQESRTPVIRYTSVTVQVCVYVCVCVCVRACVRACMHV